MELPRALDQGSSQITMESRIGPVLERRNSPDSLVLSVTPDTPSQTVVVSVIPLLVTKVRFANVSVSIASPLRAKSGKLLTMLGSWDYSSLERNRVFVALDRGEPDLVVEIWSRPSLSSWQAFPILLQLEVFKALNHVCKY